MKSLILYIKIKYVIMHVVLYMNINVLTLVKITTRHGENHAIHASASWSLLVVCLVDQDVTGDQRASMSKALIMFRVYCS